MIVVIGRVQTDEARRADLVAAGEALVSASRQDPGCLNYGLFAATEDPNAFVFVEEWESRELLDAHFATDHVRAFNRTVPALLAGAPDVRFHDIASTRGLGDIGG